MTKRFCKMNRKQIADNLGDIHRLLVAPKYLCRSCARASAEKSSLCKPAAIPPQSCQNQPAEHQQSCALLAEALPEVAAQQPTQALHKAQTVRRVVERVKEKNAQQRAELEVKQELDSTSDVFDLGDKKSLKKAKKALKKHHKQQKKLLKLAKKQQKLINKQKKLEAKVSLADKMSELVEIQASDNLH